MKSHFQLYKDEVDQLNAVFSAYKSEIADSNHLDSLGLVERHDVEIGGKTPDFIFFKEEYCLILECKSGKVSSNDKKQLISYKNIRRVEIEETIKLLCEKKYKIYRFDVVIVYEEDKLLEDIRDSKLKRIIDDLVNRGIAVLSIKRGGCLKMYGGTINNSLEINEKFKRGIQVPKHPKEVITITRNSPLEGVIYYLFKRLIDIVIERGKKDILIRESEIHTEIFKNVEINPRRINEAIKSLKNLGILEKSKTSSNKYTFNLQSVEYFSKLRKELEIKNIEDIVREKMGFESTMPLKDKYRKWG